MGLFSNTSKLNWIALENSSQLEEILTSEETSLIFKHSTRCGISSMVLNRFEKEWKEEQSLPIYFLDLLKYRSLSNQIAEKSNIMHESPQVLVFRNKQVIYNASHEGIDAKHINSLTHE